MGFEILKQAANNTNNQISNKKSLKTQPEINSGEKYLCKNQTEINSSEKSIFKAILDEESESDESDDEHDEESDDEDDDVGEESDEEYDTYDCCNLDYDNKMTLQQSIQRYINTSISKLNVVYVEQV